MLNKNLILLFSITIVFIFAFISTPVFAQTAGKIEKANSTVDVESLILDKDRAIVGCPPSWSFPGDTSSCFDEDERLILVTTKVSETDNEDLDYYYTVSGGKIMGKGANVIWNLKQAREGKYTITVGVGKDFIIFGKTLTKTVELEDCYCHEPCECPDSIKISGPTNTIKSGDLIVLKAETYFEKQLIYEWTISNGTIVSGQGTSHILVKVDSVTTNTMLKATVEFTPYLCKECGTQTESKSFQMNKDK